MIWTHAWMHCCPRQRPRRGANEMDVCNVFLEERMNVTLVFSSWGRGPRASTATTDRSLFSQNHIFNIPQPRDIQSPASSIQCSPVFAASFVVLHHLTLAFLRVEDAKRRSKQNQPNTDRHSSLVPPHHDRTEISSRRPLF